MSTCVLKALPGKLDIKRHSPSILYISTSLAMSTCVLKALPGKLDIKRHSPSILYLSHCMYLNQVNMTLHLLNDADEVESTRKSIITKIISPFWRVNQWVNWLIECQVAPLRERMLNRSARSRLNKHYQRLDSKRHSPSILYFSAFSFSKSFSLRYFHWERVDIT